MSPRTAEANLSTVMIQALLRKLQKYTVYHINFNAQCTYGLMNKLYFGSNTASSIMSSVVGGLSSFIILAVVATVILVGAMLFRM